MNVVGIYGFGKDKETLAGPLALVLGKTNYEALARLRAPGDGPVVVAVFAGKEKASELAARLRSKGFNAAVLTEDEMGSETRGRIVGRFSLGDDGLLVEPDNERIRVPFQEIDLVLRCTGIVSSSSTETVKESKVDIGSALLTGGLKITKTTKTEHEIKTEQRESFVNVYAGDMQTLVFRENSLFYDSFGPEIRQSRQANFAYLVSELRRLCPHAKYDERLLTRAGQAALLGPSLNPEKDISVATALLARVLRGRT